VLNKNACLNIEGEYAYRYSFLKEVEVIIEESIFKNAVLYQTTLPLFNANVNIQKVLSPTIISAFN